MEEQTDKKKDKKRGRWGKQGSVQKNDAIASTPITKALNIVISDCCFSCKNKLSLTSIGVLCLPIHIHRCACMHYNEV